MALPKAQSLKHDFPVHGVIGKTRPQNLQILREDTLGATCSAGPFCLLPIHESGPRFLNGDGPYRGTGLDFLLVACSCTFVAKI